MKYTSLCSCLKEYIFLKNLKSHLQNKHKIIVTSKSQRTKQRKSVWDCALCNKRINNHAELKTHFDFVHGYYMNSIGVTSSEELNTLENAYEERTDHYEEKIAELS
jgi:hypothetical protein